MAYGRGQERVNKCFVAPINDSLADRANSADNWCANASSAFLPTLSRAGLHTIVFGSKHSRPLGIDGTPVIDLRDNFESLEQVLLCLINEIILFGIMPGDLKTGVVTPIYEGGPHNLFSSYRPISILLCLSQIVKEHFLFCTTI